MLTVKNSILRSLKVIAASLLFVWLAWTFLIPGDDGNKVIAWGCFLFFSVTLIKGIVNLFDRRAKILIDANGIYFPGRKKRIIDWSEIKEFEIERNEYQDIVWIELKEGEPLHLKMFYLDIPPEVLHKHVESCMRHAAGLPDREELRKNAGKKGLADFVEPAGNKYIADNDAEKSLPDNSGRAEAQNPGISACSHKNLQPGRSEKTENAADALNDDSTDVKTTKIDLEAFAKELNRVSDSIEKLAEKKTGNGAPADTPLITENAENVDDLDDLADTDGANDADDAIGDADSILTRQWQIPQWFSDEPVTNDMIWTSVLTGGGVVMLFGLAYLEGDPPKISLAEQIIVVIAFTVLAPFFMFIHSFLRGSDTHREWLGLDTKKSVSYSVKAKKRVAAPKPQKTGESPRKARNKKHRR